MPHTPAPRRILFTAQRNEGRHLLEWIAYHKLIGFTDIFIFSNGCTDGSDAMLDLLDDAGEIRHFRHTMAEGVGAQDDAGRKAVDVGLFRQGDWVMWMDPDEYLVIKVGDGRVPDLIGAIDGWDAIVIGWRLFGDGGNATWPGRHITPKLTMAQQEAPDLTPQIKTLYRWTDKVEIFHPHRPTLRKGVTPDDFRMITSQGTPHLWRKKTKGGLSIPFKSLREPGDLWKLAQVNHYILRTPDLFAEKKARGRGSVAADQNSSHYNERYYRKFNTNEVEDRTILAHEAATLAEVERLTGIVAPEQLEARAS